MICPICRLAVPDGDQGAATAPLKRVAVQASLLACTAGGELRITGSLIVCKRIDDELSTSEVNETVRGVAVLMHYLDAERE